MSLDAPASHSAGSPTQLSRTEQLGAFLRHRRESIEPQWVGISRLGRRRMPGLRREEMAQLTGVGMARHTWLEQGHAVRVPRQVIGTIIQALLYNETEAHHLFNLTGLAAPTSARRAVCKEPPAATQTILDALGPLPAMIQNVRFDIRDYNRAYYQLVDIDLAEIPEEDRNYVYPTLTHGRWRYCMVNHEEALPRVVGFFHATVVERIGDPLRE